YSPKLNYGIHYSVEIIFMNSPRFSIIPEIGFNFISGQIKLRKYSGAISESNTVFEDQLDINFYSLFLYSAYAVQYELFKNSGIGIFVAPKMSIRILNKGDILLEKYTVDYDKSPINREFNGSQEINAGYDLSGFQSFIEIGFNKSIPMKSNLLKFGIKYGLPLVYLYSPVN